LTYPCGWSDTCHPARGIYFSKDGEEINPFQITALMLAGHMEPGAWVTAAEDIGIADLNLAPEHSRGPSTSQSGCLNVDNNWREEDATRRAENPLVEHVSGYVECVAGTPLIV